MRLVPGNTFKTQWSTTSERFRDVPAATPESDEWADRPGRYSHTGIVEEDQWAEALRRLAGVVSARPIPILYNDADLASRRWPVRCCRNWARSPS